MKSYTSRPTTFGVLLQEAVDLYRSHSTDISGHVRGVINNLKLVEIEIHQRYGMALRDLDILDVGAGQFLIQLLYFSRRNRAVGIDWDVIVHGANPIQYLKMLLVNGPKRTAKTAAGKLLGVDRRYRAEVRQQLALPSLPKLIVHRMDACRMSFPDQSFDFVHSYSVFHHLGDPGAGLGQVVRILRPGGVAYISLHLFTSETGFCGRALKDDRGEVIRWAHLRPQFAERVAANAYLNRLRLNEWCALFRAKMPGAEIIPNPSPREEVEEDAKFLLDRGELPGYSLEELLVHDLNVFWRKP
jgi:SAM-dependent methyltransferase